MRAIRGRAAARRAVAGLLTGLLAAAGTAVGAGTAAAGDAGAGEPQHGGAHATLDGLNVHDRAVIRHDGAVIETGAGLFEMSVTGGGSLLAYGIDMYSSTQQDARYAEVPWRSSSLQGNPDAGKIRWILRHSYPQVDNLAELAEEAGARQLTPETAAAGTQVAIWRYSERTESGERPDVTAVHPDAERLADHLERRARELEEPAPAVRLESPVVSGRPGELLGPVTIRTTAQAVSVAPGPEAARHGVRVVDARGKTVTAGRDGTRLWFDVPDDAEDGGGAFTVQATTPVPVGRTFVGTGAHAASQSLVVAGSSDAAVTATAVTSWAAEGAAPAVSARRDCARGAVAVTVVNRGDAPFAFALGEQELEIPGGATDTATVPVAEDQRYDITVTGPGGFERTFTGVLDCETIAAQPQDAGLTVHSEPVTVGGSDGEVNLAETGSGTNVPLLVGLAAGLLALGGLAVLMVRRKPQPGAGSAAAPDAGDGAEAERDEK
ncbi:MULTISPECIES: TQXA domain-containing protein [unclassified Streptomyces]|uniref:TQXA domain-containing protein n=1 Tax=unclassified Streptomyces TaxID=2593676 RepID=UPI0022B744D2|nr:MULTISPECIES: TQXA domain-containing protein [unclassified Streptomyces]MCZ7414266.1 TQXA domain-containing protein [Streptomyces sp. WMMC897]MCZ7431284.1 TQXA domain-containing protein [Streptomyces sp. WMMC1477]